MNSIIDVDLDDCEDCVESERCSVAFTGRGCEANIDDWEAPVDLVLDVIDRPYCDGAIVPPIIGDNQQLKPTKSREVIDDEHHGGLFSGLLGEMRDFKIEFSPLYPFYGSSPVSGPITRLLAARDHGKMAAMNKQVEEAILRDTPVGVVKMRESDGNVWVDLLTQGADHMRESARTEGGR